MDSSFESCCSDDTVSTLIKPALPELVDDSSRDSGIGNEDDVTTEVTLSAHYFPETNASRKLLYSSVQSVPNLNFRSLRSLSFGSPSEGCSPRITLFDDEFSPLCDTSVNLLNTETTKFDQASATTPNLSDQVGRLGIQNNSSRKRPSPIHDGDDTTPVNKRRRGMGRFRRFHSLDLVKNESNSKDSLNNTPNLESPLSREKIIIDTLDRVSDDANLISDGTKTCCLPTIQGKHQGLKSISSETLAKVVNKEFDDVIGKYVIVDCRYPYEFEGGHIKGAVNYYTRELIMENLVNSPIRCDDPSKRTVLFFHCEFSSERGPKLCRFLRATDREQNKDAYPYLFYPEIYILHGGYKDFFGTDKELCEPQTYVPMVMDGYKEDFRKLKVKSKSWAGEKQRSGLRRGLKF